MKRIYLGAFLFVVLFPLLTNAQSEEVQAPIRINEVMLSPLENDQPWIELYSENETPIDLTDWHFENDLSEQFMLQYVISEKQYLIITLSSEEENTPFTNTEVIRLVNDQEEVIDEWELPPSNELGSSLIKVDEEIQITYFPTAGRANLFIDEPLCSEDIINDTSPNDDDETPAQPLESGTIVINEVFANPLGDEIEGEFIELYNTENRSINLERWIIADASKEYVLEPVIIQPHNYLVLKRTTTSIALNNGAETITLTDPFNKLVHELTYEKATEGKSWNYQPIDSWYEQFPTPGKTNLEPENVEPEETEEENQGSSEEEDDTQNEDSDETVEDLFDENLNQIILNELMPNPVGSDSAEWVELYNTSDETVQLSGLEITDTSKSFFFTDQVLLAGEYYLLEKSESSIALNNSNETITLLIDNEIIDEFTYETSSEGKSWARFENEWEETDLPTPQEENQGSGSIDDASGEEGDGDDEEQKVSASSKKVKATPIIKAIPLDDWSTIDEGEKVTVSGVIIASPGLFQKRTAILQSINASPPIGIELYFHNADWPKLTNGDLVSITGEKSVTQNGDRLLIREKESIAVEGTELIEPIDFAVADNNVLAIVKGKLIEQTTKELLIDYNGDEFIITPPAGLPTYESGLDITVTGIVKRKKEEKTLVPRTIDDIVAEAPEIVEVVLEEETNRSEVEASEANTLSPFVWMGLSGSVSVAGVLGGVYRKKLIGFLNNLRESRE